MPAKKRPSGRDPLAGETFIGISAPSQPQGRGPQARPPARRRPPAPPGGPERPPRRDPPPEGP